MYNNLLWFSFARGTSAMHTISFSNHKKYDKKEKYFDD